MKEKNILDFCKLKQYINKIFTLLMTEQMIQALQ